MVLWLTGLLLDNYVMERYNGFLSLKVNIPCFQSVFFLACYTARTNKIHEPFLWNIILKLLEK